MHTVLMSMFSWPGPTTSLGNSFPTPKNMRTLLFVKSTLVIVVVVRWSSFLDLLDSCSRSSSWHCTENSMCKYIHAISTRLFQRKQRELSKHFPRNAVSGEVPNSQDLRPNHKALLKGKSLEGRSRKKMPARAAPPFLDQWLRPYNSGFFRTPTRQLRMPARNWDELNLCSRANLAKLLQDPPTTAPENRWSAAYTMVQPFGLLTRRRLDWTCCTRGSLQGLHVVSVLLLPKYIQQSRHRTIFCSILGLRC